MMLKSNLPALVCLLLGALAAAAQQNELEFEVDFETDIRPLLSDRCFHCHGPDEDKRRAGLRLDMERAAKEYAIVPGEPHNSEFMERITSEDPDFRMPPPATKLPSITTEEARKFENWIADGAKWKRQWAFVPVENIEPLVSNDAWIRNPIDSFVLKKLKVAKLEPSELADRYTLIRRLSFDITGLPPTSGQVKEFVAHSDFEAAIDALVDRLLGSSRYGERMAVDWLDVARYSDSYGYQVDRDRRVWPWRDWVIGAFNENKPYDQFVTEQLAGDLVSSATDQQILATAFNRLHPQKVEGGSVEEEFRIEYVADRTQTFATAFLGLTVECARCHDHKYDPISQREYYQLSAFFDDIDEAGVYSFFTNSTPTPTLALPDIEQRKDLESARLAVSKLENALRDYAVTALNDKTFQNWLDTNPPIELPEPVFHERFDQETTEPGANKSAGGIVGQALEFTGDDEFKTNAGNFRRHQPFSISLWLNAGERKERAVVMHRSRGWLDAASRGYQLLIEDGKLNWSLIHFWPGNAISIKSVKEFPADKWTHVIVTYDGSSTAAGLGIFVNGRRAATEIVRDHLTRKIIGGGVENIALGARFRDYGFTGGKVDELRVFEIQLTESEAAVVYQADSLEQGKIPQSLELYLARHDENYQSAINELQSARDKLFELQNSIHEIMVMKETKTPRSAYLLRRGLYSDCGDEVFAGTPGELNNFGDRPANRLGLASWLFDRDNPLTSRVYVNRVWQMFFGQGLVRTPEDFGSQGQPPTHPRLLDWLAADLMQSGWDTKRLVKQIVTSATYLQSSANRKELLELDPENRLLARGPRQRLSAEMLRDNALFASRLLSDKLGGKPARPYEVEVSFKPTEKDKGEGLYRRSLYTYWKRTAPAPMMMALDASKRDVCRVRREPTSSPLQAFVLMNSPQFVEASRALAERLLSKYDQDDPAILKQMFLTLTSRPASESEMKIIERLFSQQLTYFQDQPQQAAVYLRVGEKQAISGGEPARLAAFAAVANAMFGFDDVVMKK